MSSLFSEMLTTPADEVRSVNLAWALGSCELISVGTDQVIQSGKTTLHTTFPTEFILASLGWDTNSI